MQGAGLRVQGAGSGLVEGVAGDVQRVRAPHARISLGPHTELSVLRRTDRGSRGWRLMKKTLGSEVDETSY